MSKVDLRWRLRGEDCHTVEQYDSWCAALSAADRVDRWYGDDVAFLALVTPDKGGRFYCPDAYLERHTEPTWS